MSNFKFTFSSDFGIFHQRKKEGMPSIFKFSFPICYINIYIALYYYRTIRTQCAKISSFKKTHYFENRVIFDAPLQLRYGLDKLFGIFRIDIVPHLPYAFPLSLEVSDEYVSSKLKVADTQVCNAIAPLTLIQQFLTTLFSQF